MDGADTPRLDDLDPAELRVLGCLIEKEATTPDSYPLTINSLRNACNQATSRDPVVAYGEREVGQALASLRARGLTRTVHSTSNRAAKYRHVVPDVLGLDPAATALLSVLLLRGPQTPGELKGRSERQHHFASVEEVGEVLAELARRTPALVRRLARAPGQKDARWVHLLAPVPLEPAAGPAPTSPTSPGSAPAAGDDPYGRATAEFYDLLAAGMWESLGLVVLDLLEGADPDEGPVLDVGSGTGVGLAYVQAALPGVRIVAVEPSKAMRVGLHARLSLDDRLRAVTTVVPATFGDAALPSRACALVASAVLGHLSEPERTRLWRFVAEQMPVGAPAVVGVVPPDRPIAVPATRYRSLAVGDHVYEGWQEGTPIDARTMGWTMTYKVLAGDVVVAEQVARSRWTTHGVDDVRAAVEPWALAVEEHEGCVVLRRTR